MSVEPQTLGRWKDVILKHAPCFDRFTEDADIAFAGFATKPVKLGGLEAPLMEHAETDTSYPDFVKRLKIFGHEAQEAGLERYRRVAKMRAVGFGDPVKEWGALTAEDLAVAGGTVLLASGTGLCDPG